MVCLSIAVLALSLASLIQSTLSGSVVIQSVVGTIDKFVLQNSTCRLASGGEICESFGAQQDGHKNGENCSCICPNSTTFGIEGKSCSCLSNRDLYEGCSKGSRVDDNVLHPGSEVTVSLPSKNCSSILLYKIKNGSWIEVDNSSKIIALNSTEGTNGSVPFSLKVSNSTQDFQGILYNVIINCLNHSSTCLLLKLSSKLICPITGLLEPTDAPTTTVDIKVTDSPERDDFKKGELAAIIVGCLLFLVLVLVILYVCICRKHRNKDTDRKESRKEVTSDQDVERRTSEAVMFSEPSRSISQRKDSDNAGFVADDGNTLSEDSEEPDYDMPIPENHSIVSEFFNRIRKPRSVKNQSRKENKNEENSEDETDYYQVMNKLETPDNIQNTAVYENVNTNGMTVEAKQPNKKKNSKQAKSKKGKSRKQETRGKDGKKKNGNAPQVEISMEDIPKIRNEDNVEQENFYENNEVIKDHMQHDSPPRTPSHGKKVGYSNDDPEEEGPPPPPRTFSLHNVLDEPSNQTISSPRVKPQGSHAKDGLDSEFAGEDVDESALYENTR